MRFYTTVLLLVLTTSIIAQNDIILNTYSKQQLLEDYDLMVSSLKEAHAGLYWYNSVAAFNAIVNEERGKIKEDMNSYEFFRIASKIVTATKEGHSYVGSSSDIHKYFSTKLLFLPVVVKMVAGKPYVLNNIENNKTIGNVITKINNVPIEEIISTLLSYTSNSADGYIETGKIRRAIDGAGFAFYYADYFENKAAYTIEIQDSKTKATSTIKVNALNYEDFGTLRKQIRFPKYSNPIELQITTQEDVAQLSIHSFRHTEYDKDGDEKIAFSVFSTKVDSVFNTIQKSGVKNLIIDIRQNGGGTEGYEDYVFSYLTDKPYSKYKYVQANALTFSFLDNTQHNTPEKQLEFEKAMEDEFYLEKDGRYLRKKNFMKVASPKENPFKGKLFVLISGKTYSGGSEFAALLKGHSNAVFIGEETGGGFYGQTSGFGLTLYLPNTKLRVRVPLLKFVVNVAASDIPIGRGIIPDYEVEPSFEDFINKKDTELEYTFKLINGNK